MIDDNGSFSLLGGGGHQYEKDFYDDGDMMTDDIELTRFKRMSKKKKDYMQRDGFFDVLEELDSEKKEEFKEVRGRKRSREELEKEKEEEGLDEEDVIHGDVKDIIRAKVEEGTNLTIEKTQMKLTKEEYVNYKLTCMVIDELCDIRNTKQ